jgi:hypothetical protein
MTESSHQVDTVKEKLEDNKESEKSINPIDEIILDNAEIILQISRQNQMRHNKNFVNHNTLELGIFFDHKVMKLEKNLIKVCKLTKLNNLFD